MRYLALGDSFTIGTGITPERAFPAVLAHRWRDAGIECVLRNPAVNGYTTDDLIREELPLVAAFRPDLVTILTGANDVVSALRGAAEVSALDLERYRSQLRLIHEAVRRDAPRARRYALPQPDWSLSPAAVSFGEIASVARAIERFNDIAREEIERSDGAYIDLFPLMRDQARRGMLAPDGLHPSAEAHAAWAEALLTTVSASSP